MIGRRLRNGGSVLAAVVAVTGLGLVLVRTANDAPASPVTVSMVDGARAMDRVATVMQTHGRAMLAEGSERADAAMTADGQRWLDDGAGLLTGGRWMSMDPLSPANLATPPAELARQGTWGELTRTAQAMRHVPERASATDLRALRQNGQAMVGEGQAMRWHAHVMSEAVSDMAVRHAGTARNLPDLLAATEELRRAGHGLEATGGRMVAYADRMSASLGAR
ncbi:MAG: hypothetical protein IT306_10175 [Chloroflexi bacterium]|nr:hypothetical protein [Chloroflexota bacterium]